MLFAAQVWHFWIAVPLMAGAVFFGVAMVVGYLNKVVRPKYPPRGRT
ncbi:MAG: hypothetical protein H0U29_02495 [Acidimicrobiia bacterium]|jgi:hypothetical protein|nr:hypothetical protein [Acidimicrobiia bacterium]